MSNDWYDAKPKPKRDYYIEETETNMFAPVWKTRVRCKSQRVYHSNRECKRLLTAKTILKGRLGSVLAVGYKKHC